MPGETTRKIINLGGSGVIAIPPDFRRYFGLRPGSKVKILYDSLLLVIPPGGEQKLRQREAELRRLLE
jgi:bifunctional DNA-binding transcriptional regulator/antitoxin component of YhaV-PrlF toxin-antitoxin module